MLPAADPGALKCFEVTAGVLMPKFLGRLLRRWSPAIQPEDRENVEKALFAYNLARIRVLAWLTVVISIGTFAILSVLMPKIDAMVAREGVGNQIQVLRIAMFAAAFSYLVLSRSASSEVPCRTQKIFGYLFLLLLLGGLALHTGIFQALRPLIAPYLIGVFAVASFTFLTWPMAVGIFSFAWAVAFVSQIHFQPDEAIMAANLIHLTVMTLVALIVSRVTFNFKVKEVLAHRQIERLSHTDQLTGLATRRLMDKVLREEWSRCKRYQKPLGVLMADVDFFKPFNDTYGHQAGDECLRTVSEIFRSMARRGGDLAARYGGEEILMILPNTDIAGVANVGEIVRESVERLGIPNAVGLNGTLTVSLGAACVTPSDESNIQSLIGAADEALYKAKSQGRNRLVLAEDGAAGKM
ncbi:MAG: GGDEF domain-containing protein, partial [Deltaproteobacteria bacterium]|nr:GGDEF domain-containing protein [Deltaproteobacteria bacterium]